MDPRRHVPPPGRTGTAPPRRMLAWLLVMLAAAAGSLDAFCVVRLGGAFASVITGNLVQLGRGAALVDLRLVGSAAAAVGGYAVGVAAGTAGLGAAGPGKDGPGKDGPGIDGTGRLRRTGLVAGAELALLVSLSAGWQAAGGRPGHTAACALLAAAGAAMGMQSVLTIGTGVRAASTTYLTGTLTDVVRGVTDARRRTGLSGEAARLAALLCGAVAGALVLSAAPLWAPVLPAVLVAAVLLVGVVRHHELGRADGAGTAARRGRGGGRGKGRGGDEEP